MLRKIFGPNREEATGSLEDLIVDGRIDINVYTKEIGQKRVDWTVLVEDMSRWRGGILGTG